MSIESICHQFEIVGLILFGSGVQNRETAGDIDLCYIRSSALDYDAKYACIDLFSAFFDKEKIDLVYWSHIPTALKKEISDNHQILFGNTDLVLDFINTGERMFWDEKKYYDLLFLEMKSQHSHE